MEHNIFTGWGSKHILIGIDKALNLLPLSESRSVLTKRDCLSRNVLTSFSRTVTQGELLVRFNSKFRENLGFFLIKNANFIYNVVRSSVIFGGSEDEALHA